MPVKKRNFYFCNLFNLSTKLFVKYYSYRTYNIQEIGPFSKMGINLPPKNSLSNIKHIYGSNRVQFASVGRSFLFYFKPRRKTSKETFLFDWRRKCYESRSVIAQSWCCYLVLSVRLQEKIIGDLRCDTSTPQFYSRHSLGGLCICF